MFQPHDKNDTFSSTHHLNHLFEIAQKIRLIIGSSFACLFPLLTYKQGVNMLKPKKSFYPFAEEEIQKIIHVHFKRSDYHLVNTEE